MQNSFVLVAGDEEEESVLWAEIVLLLFRVSFRTDRRGTEYFFLQYMEHKLAPDEGDTELDNVCLKWCTTEEQNSSTVKGEEPNDKTELNLRKWFGVEHLRAISGVVHLVRGNYGTLPLSRLLPWP